MTRKQGLRDVGLEEMPGGRRAKMGKAREGTCKILSEKKCLQMHHGWGDASPQKCLKLSFIHVCFCKGEVTDSL